MPSPQIYCVVRAKKGLTAADRLKELFKVHACTLLCTCGSHDTRDQRMHTYVWLLLLARPTAK